MGQDQHDVRQKLRAALAIYPPEGWSLERCQLVMDILDPDPANRPRALADMVYAAAKLAPDDNTGFTKHTVWDIQQLMSALNPHVDLMPSELMAIAVVLAAANERRLGRGDRFTGRAVPPPTPFLSVVNG